MSEVLTEEAAKRKWCPFTRCTNVLSSGDGPRFAVAVNRWDGIRGKTIGPLCVASACMAWHWGDGMEDGAGVGYCGLAGKP